MLPPPMKLMIPSVIPIDPRPATSAHYGQFLQSRKLSVAAPMVY